MCDCEDRPCCGCASESDLFGRYEPDPIDAERERMENDYWYDAEDEDEDEDETETSPIHEDRDFLTD